MFKILLEAISASLNKNKLIYQHPLFVNTLTSFRMDAALLCAVVIKEVLHKELQTDLDNKSSTGPEFDLRTPAWAPELPHQKAVNCL
jgi:hypothetical protein